MPQEDCVILAGSVEAHIGSIFTIYRMRGVVSGTRGWSLVSN